MLTNATLDGLHTLRLPGMMRGLVEQRDHADYGALGFEERLAMLVDRELTERANRRLDRALKAAKLRFPATVEGIDFRRQRGLERAQVRSLAEWVSSDAKTVTQDMIGGHGDGVVHGGPVPIGDVICFEVAYDGLVRDTVTGGGQLLAVQTNNATFDPTEAGQQLAMVRLRAVEHGRSALMVSTVGISGYVDAHGRVTGATSFNTRAVDVRELRLGTARTLATRLGAGPEYALVGAALLALLLAAVRRGRGRLRHRRAAPTSEGVA